MVHKSPTHTHHTIYILYTILYVVFIISHLKKIRFVLIEEADAVGILKKKLNVTYINNLITLNIYIYYIINAMCQIN